jgi:cytochrome c-type biogenesis protein CcmH/NrfG
MSNRERQSPDSQAGQPSEQNQNALDEAQALFERMAGEVTRRSESERAQAQNRGPVVRLLLVLTIVMCLAAAATGLYGAYNFPDAPIRETAGVYVGKGGKIHTQEEFEAFVLWKQVMFIVFPSAFVLGFVYGITDAGQRRKRRS